jgi:polyphosphate glucokinase
MRTLAIDIGGSHLKASILDDTGAMLAEPVRMDTPVGSPPPEIVEALVGLVAPLAPFDRASIGFPGVVRNGRVLTAPNLGHEGWSGFDLAQAMSDKLGCEVRVLNDADMQGLAVIAGKGVEVVVTLGTGFGTAIYVDGRLGCHLELAHHPFRKGETYDAQLGNRARKRVGNRKWNRRVGRAIRNLRTLTTFDHLYLGGGNAKKVMLELAPDVTIVSNTAGIAGGIALWRE